MTAARQEVDYNSPKKPFNQNLPGTIVPTIYTQGASNQTKCSLRRAILVWISGFVGVPSSVDSVLARLFPWPHSAAFVLGPLLEL